MLFPLRTPVIYKTLLQWTYKLFLLSEQEEKYASLSVKENLLTSQENVIPLFSCDVP